MCSSIKVFSISLLSLIALNVSAAVPQYHIDPLPRTAPPEVTPAPAPDKPPLFALPAGPKLTDDGENLIIEFEVGGRSGYNPRPELPDLRYSGVTVGIGYDLHQVSKGVILSDWNPLPSPAPQRLAATQPFYGRTAVQPWKQVRDIIVPWMTAFEVFNTVDVAREYAAGKRAFPGFVDLRPNAQAALISLGFNRGWATNGPNRTEMRVIRDLVPKKDYRGMAEQLRKMVRVWNGTSIYNGMHRRRLAEAQLMEKE